MTLRPYQLDALERTRDAIRRGVRAILLQLPTGAGKTHLAAEGMIAPAVAKGWPVVWVSDLEEINTDTAQRLTTHGLRVGIVQSGRALDPSAPVQVCSLQTLARHQERGDALPSARLVILDEAHVSSARTARSILGAYRQSGALVLGLTATPARGDGQPLDEFEALVTGPSMRELIALGALVPPRVLAPDRVLDKGVCEDPVKAVLSWAAERRCCVFAPDAASAADLAARLTAQGHTTVAVLDGMGRDARRQVRARLVSGEVQSLVTVRALQKGFDAPVLDCAVLCTLGSIVSYLQSIGRALRAHPESGKRDAMVLDLRGAVWVHGLPEEDRIWTLDGTQGRACAEPALSLRRCSACHAIFSGAKTRCPREGCGAILVSHARGLRVQRAAMIEASGVSREVRAERYHDAIRDRLLKAGKPAHVAAKVARSATEKRFSQAAKIEQNEEVRNVG